MQNSEIARLRLFLSEVQLTSSEKEWFQWMIKNRNYVDDQTKTKCISLYLRILEAHIGMSCIELSAFNHESKQSPKKLW